MTPGPVTWLAVAILLALAGAFIAARLRDPWRAARCGLAFSAGTLVATVAASAAFYLGEPAHDSGLWGSRGAILAVDDLSALLLPLVALLHFLTALATPRARIRQFSATWSLVTEAIALATFGCADPWLLVSLLAAGVLPPLVELVNRGKPVRVYGLHMLLFVALLAAGRSLLEPAADGGLRARSAAAAVALLVAVMVRCGTVPVHAWVTDWFEHASFGIGLLFVAPLTGVYAAARLLVPVAPDWALRVLGIAALVTAVYAAAMATVQRDARRFFAFLFLSHGSLVLVGLEQVHPASLAGGLHVWSSVLLALGGFGLTLRALEARFGRLSLARYHGLYDDSPSLAVCFLLTGLASVGFPGTVGFVGAEMLVHGAVDAEPAVGVAVVAAGALNGIAVLRAYFLLFTGTRHASAISLGITPRERIAVLTMTVLILGGGLFPQPAVTTRYRAAEQLLKARASGNSNPATHDRAHILATGSRAD
jgi:NADH-quinone oxidoreductase subunit M